VGYLSKYVRCLLYALRPHVTGRAVELVYFSFMEIVHFSFINFIYLVQNMSISIEEK